MNKTCIYTGALVIGLLSTNIEFLIPVYLFLPKQILSGQFPIFLKYFVFGLPPVVVYFRLILNDSWLRSLFKGVVIILINVLLLVSFLIIIRIV